MSRIASSPVTLPSGVEVKLDGGQISVKGKMGSLQMAANSNVDVKLED
ncbi:MAG: 50S ribosomal protein L6, partial [Pseudomonadales bacterium]|nr:50S ribosomal protein L6 [Pseudomonadales bacterium]